ncbi:MAG: ATP-dependent DNA helicase PcrA [Bacillota bacterium]|nr:MAG: ATP-dependent DNA helicase PcrA [Bacillota bacterium]
MDEILQKLNEEQIKPVMDTEGAVLVLAGAGSGKTRVLTSRIAYLVENKGAHPSSILAITFTNKAANEMKERLSAMIDGAQSMWICTIHSMCVRILRLFADRLGYNKNFSIYSETERTAVIKRAFAESGLEDEKLLKNIKFHIANAKMLGQEPEEYARDNADLKGIREITAVYAAYCDHLKKNNALDFDDLLTQTLRLLETDRDALEYLSGKFRYIHVDEFQDTNRVQYEIIRLLATVHGNLFAVGDDDQSIYGWRGAKIENILDFEKDFKGAKVYKLERNYRSTKNILKLANTVIKNNGRRKDKVLWTSNQEGVPAQYYQAETENDEALYVARTISQLMNTCNYKFSDFAVLMRINALSRAYEQEFAKYNVPFKVFGGFKFFERKEIKDLLAYLRVINNPFDSEAVTRIVNVPKRGIGAKTVETLEQYANETELSVYDAVLDVDSLPLNAGSKQKVRAFGALLKELVIKGATMSADELIRDVINDSGILSMYADDSDESINKKANIDEFVNSVDEFCKMNKDATLSDYLNQVTLSSDTDDMDATDYVTVATIHSVKGLEFKTVFAVGMEENIFPVSRAAYDDNELEEERRLMYVAITRAEERLYFTRSRSRYLYGERSMTLPSRFMQELSSVMEVESPRSSYSDYTRRTSNGYGSSYSGYGARRSFSRQNNADEDEFGYHSDLPSEPSQTSYTSFSASAGYRRTQQNAVPSPAKSGQKDYAAFRTGVRIRHPKFGEGVIISTKGEGAAKIANVSFPGLGIKSLSVQIAPITIV